MRTVGLFALLVVGCQSETAYLGEGKPSPSGGAGMAAGGGGAATRGGTSGRASGGGSARGGSGIGIGGSSVDGGSSAEAGDSNGGVGANGGDGGGGSSGGSGARGGSGGAGHGGSAGSSGSGGSGGPNCPGGTLHADIVVTTPSELAEIQGYDTIDGNLQITGDVSDLTPLACLKQITGDLVIGCANAAEAPCPSTVPVTTLTGLDALTTVGGLLTMSSTAVVDFDGLTSLTELGGIALYYNDELLSIAGLRGVVELPHGALLVSNGRLATVEGLENVTEIGGRKLDGGGLFLLGPFVSLEGLRGLVTASSVDVAGTNLVSFDGLEGLETSKSLGIGLCVDDHGELVCLGNTSLADIHALSHLTSLGSVSIAGNPLLQDLDDLSGAISPATFATSVTIVNNASLKQVDGLLGLTGLASDFWVESNPVLDNLDGLANFTGLGSSVDFKIKSNDVLREVDLLHGTSVAEISSLVVRDNPSLVRFDALDHVTTAGNNLGGGITFSGNPALTEISGFHVTTGNFVILAHCPSLTTTDAFSQLVTTDLTVQDTGFTNLEAFAALTGSDGLSIASNDALLTLDGLEHLTRAGSVDILLNPLLTNLRGLGNLTTVPDDFVIENNATLPECEAQWLCGLVPSSACNTEGNAGTGTCQ